MPRRRLSQRQIERVQRIQERRRRRLEERTQLALDRLDEERMDDDMLGAPRPGRVVVRYGANLAVEDEHGQLYHCLCRQHVGQPVCGDRVVWQPTGEGNGVVTALQPRETLLSRPGYSGRDRPLAANISLLVAVVAPRPEPSSYLIDQYLVAARLIGVPVLVLCNKMDLCETARDRHRFLSNLTHYQAIGYPLIAVSAKQTGTLDALIDQLTAETAILLGQSGVGKSSLIKALLPDREVQIGRLSKATGLGRHTTSAATCYRLPGGGSLIDSPGVRSFRLGPISRRDLERGFREIEPFIARCRFANCRHEQEPDCAVRKAVAAGEIDPRRLANFQHLAAQLEGND
jgi:ribosome biogenesis GTPase